MANEIETKLKVTADDKSEAGFESFARNAERAMERYHKAAEHASERNEKIAQGLENTGKYLRAATGVGIGVGIAEMTEELREGVKEVAELDRRFVRLGINAGSTQAEVNESREKLAATATRWGLGLEDVISGYENLVNQLGSLKEADDNIDLVAQASQGLGIRVEQTSTLIQSMKQQLDITGKGAELAFDKVTVGANQGHWATQDMIQALIEVAPHMKDIGLAGQGGLTKTLAMMSAVQKSFQNSAEAGMAFRGVMEAVNGKKLSEAFEKARFGGNRNFEAGIRDGQSKGFDALTSTLEMTDKSITRMALTQWQWTKNINHNEKTQAEAISNRFKFIKEIFKNPEQAKAVEAILRNSASLDKWGNELDHSQGVNAKQARQFANDTIAAMNDIATAWTGIKETVFQGTIDLGLVKGLQQFRADLAEAGKIISGISKIIDDMKRHGFWHGVDQGAHDMAVPFVKGQVEQQKTIISDTQGELNKLESDDDLKRSQLAKDPKQLSLYDRAFKQRRDELKNRLYRQNKNLQKGNDILEKRMKDWEKSDDLTGEGEGGGGGKFGLEGQGGDVKKPVDDTAAYGALPKKFRPSPAPEGYLPKKEERHEGGEHGGLEHKVAYDGDENSVRDQIREQMGIDSGGGGVGTNERATEGTQKGLLQQTRETNESFKTLLNLVAYQQDDRFSTRNRGGAGAFGISTPGGSTGSGAGDTTPGGVGGGSSGSGRSGGDSGGGATPSQDTRTALQRAGIADNGRGTISGADEFNLGGVRNRGEGTRPIDTNIDGSGGGAFDLSGPRKPGTGTAPSQGDTGSHVGLGKIGAGGKGAFGKFDAKAPAIMGALMAKYGLSREQAAGIVGNLGHESARFTAYHEGGQASSRGGVGWAQWTGVRRRAFEKWVAARSLNPTSDVASWRYLTEGDPQTAAAIRAVKKQKTVAGAMTAFEHSFEISADYNQRTGQILKPKSVQSRLDLANRAYGMKTIAPETESPPAAAPPMMTQAPPPAMHLDTDAAHEAIDDVHKRASEPVEKKVKIRMEHQDAGGTQAMMQSSRSLNRDIRAARYNSFSDVGVG